MTGLPLGGLHVLLMEDEVLIALDVEQLCRDAGAEQVTVVHDLTDVESALSPSNFDAAVIDVMLHGKSTLEPARRLADLGVPFVFATGYIEHHEIFREFPDVAIIGKPYVGDELVEKLAHAVARKRIAN